MRISTYLRIGCKIRQNIVLALKLNRVSPIDSRPFTNYLNIILQKSVIIRTAVKNIYIVSTYNNLKPFKTCIKYYKH